MKRLYGVGAAILCAVLFVSCRTPVSGLAVESYPKTTITINSKIVGGMFAVTEVNAAKRNNLLQAQVRARNETQHDFQMEYRYRWLDGKGMEVDTRTAVWAPVNVNPKEFVIMQGIAPASEVADFILDVRFRRPSVRWE